MRRFALSFAFVLAATLSSCSSTGSAVGSGSATSKESPDETIGVMAPADASAIALWPEAWAGSFLVLETLPPGKTVAKGDVIARFDARAIDDEIQEAELESRSAAIRHRATVEKNRLEEEAARSSSEQTRASIDRTKRALDGYKQREIAFAHRQDDINKQYEQARLDDQMEELNQDEKMYGEDKHIDMTEEIVLKRQRRAIALTHLSNDLSRDRMSHQVELAEKLELESLEEAMRVQMEAGERLMKTLEIDRRGRDDAESRSAEALAKQNERLERLKRDRALFELKSPRDGVLVHGSLKDYRPGKVAPRWERGAQLSPHADVYLVADPSSSAVAFDLDDNEHAHWKDGEKVTVKPIAGDAAGRTGTFAQSACEERASTDKNVYEATLRVSGDGPGFGARVRVVREAKP